MDERNWVAAEQPPARIDTIRRSDVMTAIGSVVDLYTEQQREALRQVTADVGGRGYCSDAAAVAERRRTSRLYLILYGLVSSVTMGGLALVAWLAGIDGALAVAGWMFATGATTLLLAWVRHGDEFAHSPEGIARHLADWHGSITQYQAETQRQIAMLDFAAEQQRIVAADAERRQAMELARLRSAEIAERNRMAEQQRRQYWEAWQPEAPAAVVPVVPDVPAMNEQPTVGDAFAESFVAWVVGLYDGGISDSGLIVSRVPWAARSAWAEPDKQRAKRLACNGRPALVEAVDGGRYRLRVELFPAASVAAEWVAQRVGE
jgi:hypothetical protein